MKKKQRDRIIKRHFHSIWMHGNTAHALYWESKEVQELRFDILLDDTVCHGDSVLDVGCGFADLYRHMKNKNLTVDYTGIDISPDMIDRAKQLNNSLTLFTGDLFDFDPMEQSYDWVLLSGSLNEPLEDDGAYLQKILPRLFSTCRKGVAFNLLNADYSWHPKDLYILQPYKPADVMKLLSQFTQNITQRTDYMDIDISYIARRNNHYKSGFENINPRT